MGAIVGGRGLLILMLSLSLIPTAWAKDKWRHTKTKDKVTGQVIHKIVLSDPRYRLEVSCESLEYAARLYITSGRLKAERRVSDPSSLVTRVGIGTPLGKVEQHYLTLEDPARQGVRLPIDVEGFLSSAGFLAVGVELEDGQLWTYLFPVRNLPEEIIKLPCGKR